MLSPSITNLIMATLLLASLAAPPADAHGRVSLPRVVFAGPYPDSPVDQIDGYKALPPPSGQSYNGQPETNTRAFTTAFQQSSYATLRDFVLQHQAKDVKACGASTVAGVLPQPLPATVEVSFRANEGFVPDHQGPCEVWCGNRTRVFHDDNCAKTFRDGPAKLPYDRAKCDASGDNVMTFYWLALHLPKWQLYINCAAIATRGGAANTIANATTTPMPTPTPTTVPTPTVTTTRAPDNWGNESDPTKTLAPTKKPGCRPRASRT